MVINAKKKFLSKLATTYGRALREHGPEDADARIKHLTPMERGLVKLTAIRRSIKHE